MIRIKKDLNRFGLDHTPYGIKKPNGSHKLALEVLTLQFVQYLKQIERRPVFFNCTHENQRQCAQLGKICACAKGLVNLLKEPKNVGLRNQIKQLMVGLRYRYEAINGGLSKEKINLNQLEHILLVAGRWKIDQPVFSNKLLTQEEFDRLTEAAHYPKFIQLLLRDEELRHRFFNWCLRDGNAPNPFIEFPSIIARLNEVELNMRIQEGLAIKKQKVSSNNLGLHEKILALPFFNGVKAKSISILDESRVVTLNDNCHVTIEKIFKAFKDKRGVCPGDFDFFTHTGIWNWNFHEIGSWNPIERAYKTINFSLQDWWKQLPISEQLSKKQLETKYCLKLKNGEWLVQARSTIQDLHEELRNSHSCLTIAIPLSDDHYQVYDFGKYATRYPQNSFELLNVLFHTVPANVVYPDENRFYTDRQQVGISVILNEQDGRTLMDKIRRDIEKGKDKRLYFQPGGKNCAHWVQATLQKVFGSAIPNLFKVVAIHYPLEHPWVDKLFQLIASLPEKWQNPASNLVKKMGGGNRTLKIYKNGQIHLKSLNRTTGNKEHYLYLPGFLYRQLQAKMIPEVIHV